MQKLNLIKKAVSRLNYVGRLSWEAQLQGMAAVNALYLLLWVLFAFGLFRYYAGCLSYLLSTLFASIATLWLSEQCFPPE